MRSTPIVLAYKLGRSTEAAELATSHTGALAGDDDIADAFLRECGIARVETLDGFIESMPLLRRAPMLPSGTKPHIGVVTTTGGGAAMVVDQLGVRGISVSSPSSKLADAINAYVPIERARDRPDARRHTRRYHEGRAVGRVRPHRRGRGLIGPQSS
ncbi:MAG: hypothetical protein J0H17_07710 [Rhizobiales bacterium]|nr:hypothetical protein [Hyphomicrobiales bacterium]